MKQVDLKRFVFSQNSLNTFRICPKKFRYKYIDRIGWEKDDKEYYDSMEMGRDFHLICERYFRNIPIGNLDFDKSGKFSKWIERIKNIVPIEDEKKYLPEYGVFINIEGVRINAKYDLVVIYTEGGKECIDIWDWKTENRKITYKDASMRMQTTVYMYMAYEAVSKIHGIDKNNVRIRMMYYQPDYADQPVRIEYTDEKISEDRKRIYGIIENIETSDFIPINKNGCKWCEFSRICDECGVEDLDFDYYQEDGE